MSDLNMTNNFIGNDAILYPIAESNDTFNIEAMNKTLHDLKINSFNYLYDAQLDLISYSRFDLKMSDLTRMRIGKMGDGNDTHLGYLPGSFIDENRRLSFRRSNFVGKEISIFDITSNPKLFNHLFIVFIDGKFYDNIKIVCEEERTTLVFKVVTDVSSDGIPKSLFEILLLQNADITVYFVPNCAYGVYNTNRNVLLKYKDNLALDRFNIVNSLNTEINYITFVNSNDFLFSGVVTDTVNSADMLRFSDENLENYQSRYIHLNIFGFRNLLDQVDIPGTDKFFSIPIQDMPLPVENVMIFRNINGKKLFAHDITFKLYYPNYYEVINNINNDDLTIYLFYFKDTRLTGLQHYTDVLGLYKSLLPINTSSYVNNTLPPVVKNYMPEELVYSLRDFKNNPGYPYHLSYKIEKLKSWISQNPDLLRTYIANQIEKTNSFYLDCSTIDLVSKTRLNNHTEVVLESDKVIFPEPHYVFILRRLPGNGIDYRFFIDGDNFHPIYFCKDDFYEYYYIPTSLVTVSSLLEIERFTSYAFSINKTFANVNQKLLIEFPETPGLNAEYIFIVNNLTKEFIPKNSYKISFDLNGFEIDLPTDSLKKIPNKFYVTLLNSQLENIDLVIYAKEYFFIEKKDVLTEENTADIFTFNIESGIDRRFVRLFRNQKLLPPNMLLMFFSDTFDGDTLIDSGLQKEIGDTFIIDYTPYRYNPVYTDDIIPSNGFINLRGVINKPFDLKWYDVYINGRKLNHTNIDIISPTIIFIKNVQSLRNFVIYEKSRGVEYFDFNSETDFTLNDILWNTVLGFKTEIENRPIIDDIEMNIITVLADTLGVEMRFFYENYMKKKITFINPDINQLTEYTKMSYPTVFTGNVVFLNPDARDADAIVKLKIFPNEII